MKIKTPFAAIFGIITLFLASCGAPAPAPEAPEAPKAIDMEALKVEIQAMEDAYAAGEKAKDADAVVAYYSDDAVNYSRNEDPTVGKAAIRDRIAKRLEKDTLNNTNVYKIVDLFAEGDMVVEIGSWTDVNAAGEEIKKGFYMSYFQKRDGKYVCVRDMNVTSTPEKSEM